MLNAIIILLVMAAAAGIGYDIIDILPAQLIVQVNNQEGLRVVTAGFAAFFGGLFGFVVLAAYRNLEKQVRAMPVDMLLTRSVGLVSGLLIAFFTTYSPGIFFSQATASYFGQCDVLLLRHYPRRHSWWRFLADD
jgi:uncharacterized protein YacL